MADERYIILPIILLALVGVLNILLISGNVNTDSLSSYKPETPSININVPIIGFAVNSIINGVANWLFSFMVQNFAVTSGLGLLAIVGLGIVLAFTGLSLQFGGQALATGISGAVKLSDASVMIIYKSVMFLSIWGIFSIMALTAIMSFPLFLGWIFYLLLSCFYAIGVIETIGVH